MAEDKNKKKIEAELQDEQLDEVSGGMEWDPPKDPRIYYFRDHN